MVLTNFECWAHGGSDNLSNGRIERRGIGGNSIDLFNPAVLQSSCVLMDPASPDNFANSRQQHKENVKNVSHLSSNGYYGFVAAARNSDDNENADASATTAANTDVVNTLAGNGGEINDVNKFGQQQQQMPAGQIITKTIAASVADENMDVEQLNVFQEIRTGCVGGGGDDATIFPPSRSFFVQQNNGRLDRRKRFLAVADNQLANIGDFEVMEANAKRRRFEADDHRFELNNGDLTTLFAMNPAAMENDDISMDNQSVLEHFPRHDHHSNNNNNNSISHDSFYQPEFTTTSGHSIDAVKMLKSRSYITDNDKLTINLVSDPSIDGSVVNENTTNSKPRWSRTTTTNHALIDCDLIDRENANVSKYTNNNNTSNNVSTRNKKRKEFKLTETYFCCSIGDENFMLDSNTSSSNSSNDHADTCDDNLDFNQLENLYLSLHGGTNGQVLRHLTNCFSDEIEL